MTEYWNCGELPWKDIEEFVDQNVGEALKHYIEEQGVLLIEWNEEPEPSIKFTTDGDFDYKDSLYKILVYELAMHRPGNRPDDDLFFDPEGDRRVILLQQLIRTYLKWKEGGVHQPANDSE